MPTTPSKLRRKRAGAYHHGDLEPALVAAALALIRDRGVAGLTLREVGARLRVSRTALYRHFDDKTALLARVASEGFRMLHGTLAEAIDRATAERRDVLQAMAAAYVQFALANQPHYQTMFGGYLDRWDRYPDLVQNGEAAFGILVDTIAREQRAGRVRAGDPVELAEITWSLSHGVATLGAARHLQRTPTPVEDLAVMGCRFLEEGLRP